MQGDSGDEENDKGKGIDVDVYRQTWICIALRCEHTSKELRYSTRSQGISVLPAHPAFIR